ncbi:hypothetical protein ACIPWF_00950 [Paenarthrobacter sp. NPDC089989]|uniref:hypothetical protein n=1 Tax=unclassified Paenarthrobacter TaxID=2634190 RepID=UPI00382CE3CB
MKSQSLSHFIGLALVPVLMLGLSACLPPATNPDSPSPNPAPAATSASSAAQPTAVGPTAQQPVGPAGPAAPQAEAPVVRWVPIGPVGPNDPTSGQRYLLLQQFQCDALAESAEGDPDAAVWQAAAAVCKAVQSGSQQDWLKASNAVAATPRVPQTQCLESTVAATSAAVLAQHRATPALPLKATTAPGQACPRHLSGLTVVDENLVPIPGLQRASGPRSGGTIVRLDGYYARVGDILFDGQPAFPEIVSGGGDYQTMYIQMPPAAPGSDTVKVSITDTVDITGTVTFFYEDAASAQPNPTAGQGQSSAGTSPMPGSPSATPSPTATP